jgi:hypothetical protein
MTRILTQRRGDSQRFVERSECIFGGVLPKSNRSADSHVRVFLFVMINLKHADSAIRAPFGVETLCYWSADSFVRELLS